MPRSPLTSRKANVGVPVHQVLDGLRVVVGKHTHGSESQDDEPLASRSGYARTQPHKLNCLTCWLVWPPFQSSAKCRSAYKTKTITKSTSITPESTSLAANSNCCPTSF